MREGSRVTHAVPRMLAALLMAGSACASPGGGSQTIDPTAPDAGVADGQGTDPDGAVTTPPKGYIGAYKSPTIARDGDTYHAYFAGDTVAGAHRNIPHATFTADGNWSFVGDALPHLGTDAFDGPGGYPTWAPAIARVDATHWMLYYTAQLAGTEQKKCIWRAHASNPDGPFVDDYAGPIFCAEGTLWVIDPYVIKDAQGRWHLAARVDQPGGINTIQIRLLDAAAESFAAGSSWIEMTHNAPTSWEQPVLENAGVVRLAPPSGDPHWFVFYSGGAWDNNSYGVGYADCGTGINGPCTKKTPDGPWLATDASAGVYGPGTPTFYKDAAGDMMMSVQAWKHSGGKSNPQNKGQIMRTYKLTVSDAYKPTAQLVRVDL